MGLRVVGAGLPRTGTTSLKNALERLLGAPCYHMSELFVHLDHGALWRDAAAGVPDWDGLFAGYSAGVDWPVSWHWRELSAAYPDAIVLLSSRESAERWYDSMSRTVLNFARRLRDGAPDSRSDRRPPALAGVPDDRRRVMRDLVCRVSRVFPDPDDRSAVMAVYERHLAEVRSAVPAGRLVEWRPGLGWTPLCAALGVAVPDEPFPHENTAADMVARGAAAQPGDRGRPGAPRGAAARPGD